MSVAESRGTAGTLQAEGALGSIEACSNEEHLPPRGSRWNPWRVLGRAWRVTRGWFPLTFLGLCLLTVSALILWYVGVARADMVLLVAGGALTVVVLVSVVLTIITAVLVWWQLRGARSRPGLVLEAGSAWPTGLEFTVSRWIPLGSVEWTWNGRARAGTGTLAAGEAIAPAPRGSRWRPMLRRAGRWCLDRLLGHSEVAGEGPPEAWLARLPEGWPPSPSARVYEMVVPRRRTHVRHVTRRVTVRDMLGLSAISWDMDEAVDLVVAPWRGHLDRMPAISGFVGGEDHSDPCGDPFGDRVDMRQYVPGDSPRMILWKVFARSRKLMVRVHERALTVRPRGCAYLVAGEGDEPSAGVARVILERGVLGEPWCFGADGGSEVASTLAQALPLVARSGDAEGPTMFPLFLERVEKAGFGYCILVVPPVPGPWLAPVAAALQRTALRVFVFLGLDALEAPESTRPAWRRWLLRTPPVRPVTIDDLRAVAHGLGPKGERPWVVERATGHIYGGVELVEAPPQAVGGAPWRG